MGMNSFEAFSKFTVEEKLVYDVIRTGKFTQLQIARQVRWIGSDPEFEDYKSQQTTLRKVRRTVHDLRKKGACIISDVDGYQLVESRESKIDYLNMATAKENVRAANAKNYLSGLRREWGIEENEQLKMEI
jgi:hypothetical protein